MLDIFDNNAFGVRRLTDAINVISYRPSRINSMGLFRPSSVDTTVIAIERKGDTISLVAPSARGGPGETRGSEKRDLIPLSIPHFEINDFILADSVQNVRAFGQEQALATVVQKVSERLGDHVVSMDLTEEAARLGAIKGIVTYKGGESLNLFTALGVSQPGEIDFDLDNASPADGALRKKCAGVVRDMAKAMGGLPFSGIHAFCGDNFFDDLLQHKEVRDTYKGWSEAQILRDSYIGPNRPSWGIFEFGGIVFENYRGIANSVEVATDKCHLFPVGTPGLFRTAYAPADYEETVNTMGQRLYAKQFPDQKGKGRNLDVQMNALQYCTRPNVLFQGKRT